MFEIELLSSLPAVSFRLLDILLVMVLFLGGYRGFQKGLFVELIANFAFIIGIILSFHIIKSGFNFGAEKLGAFSKAGPFLTFLIVFLIIVILINLLGRKVKSVLKYSFLDTFDNILGMILGLFKYLVALGILFKLLTYVGFITPKSEIHKTYMYPTLVSFFDYLLSFAVILSPEFIQNLLKDVQHLLKK